MFDTHCHLAFDVFGDSRADVVSRAAAAGVDGMITIATSTSNCQANLDLAEQFENVWCSAGVHPLHVDEPREWDDVRQAAMHPRCVAFGELGLDNHYEKPPRQLQRNVLDEQLAFLESLKFDGIEKPIILHCRKAFDDLIPILRATTFDPARFVFHCFTGDSDDARKVLDFGAWISLTGVVTYHNAREVADAAILIPDDRIMVETDAPFLSPEPVRSTWPCEPAFVIHTARFLAELRGTDFEKFESQLDANVHRFFGIAAV
ncbi:MAG: TatD family hydrolase [Phycisphaerales bacterium]